ncbi:hypothetical protein PVAP13_4NG221876 [Panicum virgatum]|uniref:Uncharacterized protein n=1 Tax=Panicum virgatum TaxID=38727 RepID=A0A8T0TE93_PANVG|nr:hypothetical protein PVAP13_4NG221876 [Panicum virgatum]
MRNDHYTLQKRHCLRTASLVRQADTKQRKRLAQVQPGVGPARTCRAPGSRRAWTNDRPRSPQLIPSAVGSPHRGRSHRASVFSPRNFRATVGTNPRESRRINGLKFTE